MAGRCRMRRNSFLLPGSNRHANASRGRRRTEIPDHAARSPDHARSLSTAFVRVSWQHAPMDGHGQSRAALDCDRRGRSVTPHGDPQAEAAPRHEGESRPRAAWTARWPPWAYKWMPSASEQGRRSRSRLHLLRASVPSCSYFFARRGRGGCRAAEATAGAAPAASAAAAAEGKPSLPLPFPSVPFLPLGVRSDLMMNLRAYGFADLPFVALFPSDLC